MGFLKRAIRRGVSDAVGKAIGKAIEPTVTDLTNKAANGFRQAGEYPSVEHLYKRVDGVVYHVDTEHCFEGDSDCPSIGFDKSEPRGGFDYVKPEPKKKTSFLDLFK